MLTVLLLIVSNAFMTFAWYGHLKHRSMPIVSAIVVSWLIAFGEYCFQVPANRIGYGLFTGYQLKVIQECHHSGGLRRLRLLLPRGASTLELRGVVPLYSRGCRICLLGETLIQTGPTPGSRAGSSRFVKIGFRRPRRGSDIVKLCRI
jgi:hypothetical protein